MAAEGFTHPYKLVEKMHSLAASVTESVTDLKWDNGTTAVPSTACGQNSSSRKIFGLDSDAEKYLICRKTKKGKHPQIVISLALIFL